MRRPKSGDAGAKTLREEEMADPGGLVRFQSGTERVAANFLERAREAGRVARKLNARCVGQKFALPRDGGLDEPAEKIADVTDDEKRDSGSEDNDDGAAGIFSAADAAATERPKNSAAGEAEDQNAEDDRGDPQVEPH